MPTNPRGTDTLRASREGHWFHEAWTARRAMQLLLPMDGLIGIAVEGLSEEDQSRASAGTVEIADLTVYYGRDANFHDADRVETLQFKYSPKRADKPFRASDARKTIEKFGESYRDYKQNYGAAEVTEKLFFSLVTNRPTFSPLQHAIDGIAGGRRLTGHAKTEAEQFERAAGVTGRSLVEFASKCRISGLAGTLRSTKTDLRKILVDWSATADARAAARLGAVREMVIRKAGYDARHRKVIRQVDVLDALGLSDVAELLPCPASLPSIGPVVEREQLVEAKLLVPRLKKPLIIHADGGVGKTVFLQSLASLLSQQYEVVLFDCFGGGAYRSPEDGRHLPNRGLVHIANELACRGLCDPILPGSESTEVLFGIFRKRLAQCVQTLSSASPDRELVLIIDAMDNSEEYANERGDWSFPTQLLESIQLSGSIPGVKVIGSGRTHRIGKHLTNVSYHEFKLTPFTNAETTTYLKARVTDITVTGINVAQSRSNGNARILEHIVASDTESLEPSQVDNLIILDDLLNERIEKALGETTRQGYKRKEINAFLAGLSVLPPPVPLEEYAGAHGMDIGAIRSFAADLAPLLDQTPQGMIFRDEPTETFVRESFGADRDALQRVAKNLLERQAESVYAAQALPALLQKLDEGKKLFNLAFDERFPRTITSTVGQRRIRYARLKAAVLYAVELGDYNSLVRLLVELSTIAASDQRGANYIIDNPDLVVRAQDVDALRRLYEARTSWAGSRHARLTIASVLSGDLDDASRYFTRAFNWMRHDVESAEDNEYNRARPEPIDRAAIPFFRLAEGEHRKAIRFMRIWHPWYAYEVSESLFHLLRQVIGVDRKLKRAYYAFLDELGNEIAPLTGGLSFLRLSDRRQRELVIKLGKACKRSGNLKRKYGYSTGSLRELDDGLRKAATIAASFGMTEYALSISLRAAKQRPRIWSMVDLHSERDIFPYLFDVALRVAVSGTKLHERDVLPEELLPLAKGIRRSLTGDQFKKVLKDRLQTQMKKERGTRESEPKLQEDIVGNTDRLLDYRLSPLLELTRALADFLGAPLRQADGPFQELVRVWVRLRLIREGYYYELKFNRFFQLLGDRIVTFALWARGDLKAVSVRFLLKHLHQQDYLFPSTLIGVIGIVADKPRFDVIVGEQAVQAKALIEREDDVITRSDLFAKLAGATLPIDGGIAAEFFRAGLEQLDAIGSGDLEFTNELLNFASSTRGNELSEVGFHTLTNLCELNMSYEPEKFAWGIFGKAMSKTSGARALAKLSRWHDRGKIGLEYTLLPYLTAMVQDGKIVPEDALALNRLADPAELWVCNTEAFANTIHGSGFTSEEAITRELIRQYEENNRRLPLGSTVKRLADIASQIFGSRNSTTRYLSKAHVLFTAVQFDLNEQQSDPQSNDIRSKRSRDCTQRRMEQVRNIAAETNPLDETSLRNSVCMVESAGLSREHEQIYFRTLRTRMRLVDRSTYVKNVAQLEELDIYTKLRELDRCKEAWTASSADLDVVYRTLVTPIIHNHLEDFLHFGVLSTSQIKRVADLAGMPVSEVALDLVKALLRSDWAAPASAWLGFGTIFCGDAEPGKGQKALESLMSSGTAKLASAVVDGPWKRGLYPGTQSSDIASGLVWQLLGSPRATDRWRAAHSVRCFARLGRWEVVHSLARKVVSMDSKVFGAPELPFYYLHAQLWLLVALARVAVDFPSEIAKHKKVLLEIALGNSHPHVVIRHFAALAILSCDKAGVVVLPEKQREQLRTVNDSSLPRRSSAGTDLQYAEFYKRREEDAPEPRGRFTLDYDFEKYSVNGLASIFGQPGWAVKECIRKEVQRIDPSVNSMYNKGGREMRYRSGGVGLSSRFHVYGQYLAWHALRFVAAKLVSRHPVSEEWEWGDRWSEWLSHRFLTRGDGLWLSDGMDRPPLRTKVNVVERGNEGLELTGDRDKLMSLVGIDKGKIGKGIVVAGDWKSPDGVNVHINSALVDCRKGRRLAKEFVSDGEAFFMWLPSLSYEDGGHGGWRREKSEYEPWIVCPDAEGAKLDAFDPLSTISVERRPRFVTWVAEHYFLRPDDPFERTWRTRKGTIAATTDAWGYEVPFEDDNESGERLVCRTKFLNSVLEWKNSDLIVLIKLRRYEEGNRHSRIGSRFSNSVAILRVSTGLKVEYFAGPVNEVKEVGF